MLPDAIQVAWRKRESRGTKQSDINQEDGGSTETQRCSLPSFTQWDNPLCAISPWNPDDKSSPIVLGFLCLTCASAFIPGHCGWSQVRIHSRTLGNRLYTEATPYSFIFVSFYQQRHWSHHLLLFPPPNKIATADIGVGSFAGLAIVDLVNGRSAAGTPVSIFSKRYVFTWQPIWLWLLHFANVCHGPEIHP